MKPSACLFASFFAAIAPLTASVSIECQFGLLRDSSGAVISSTNMLWAIIYDANNDGQLPGGLGTNESLTADDSNSAHSAFLGRTLSQNLEIGGDKVISVGDELLDGTAIPYLASVDLAASGLTTGGSYGFYWFPGSTLVDQNLDEEGFQVGGINELLNYYGAGDNAYIGTKIPADGASVATYLLDPSVDGTIATGRLTAIDAVPIPEPSATLLGTLAGLLFLRRRRA